MYDKQLRCEDCGRTWPFHSSLILFYVPYLILATWWHEWRHYRNRNR